MGHEVSLQRKAQNVVCTLTLSRVVQFLADERRLIVPICSLRVSIDVLSYSLPPALNVAFKEFQIV